MAKTQEQDNSSTKLCRTDAGEVCIYVQQGQEYIAARTGSGMARYHRPTAAVAGLSEEEAGELQTWQDQYRAVHAQAAA